MLTISNEGTYWVFIVVILFALYLQKLDLSYNNLSPADVLALGGLKKLRELDISANNLVSLPVDISDSR